MLWIPLQPTVFDVEALVLTGKGSKKLLGCERFNSAGFIFEKQVLILKCMVQCSQWPLIGDMSKSIPYRLEIFYLFDCFFFQVN